MTGAVALAVILVIVVATLSLAFRANQAGATGRPGAGGRSGMPGRGMPGRPGPTVRPPRRQSPKPSRREEPVAEPAPPAPSPEPAARTEPPSDLLRTGRSATAKVISVVDERTLGSTTRSRITLRVEPEGDDPFDAQLRVLFSTPEKRASIRVGGSVGVRFDPDNHNKIVLDLPEA